MAERLTGSDGGLQSCSSRQVGAVIIGRNEGERLKACIRSVVNSVTRIVYVDSGSTDGSAEWAKQNGIDVLALDLSKPFTAARARNEGFARLLSLAPECDYVQFVDGDCEVQPTWLGHATTFLEDNADVAVVCGRRRERYPESSIFNRLCDVEWDTPIGQAFACGGDSMMRTKILQDTGGFRDDVIAGEEPELCYRIRQGGWKIWRLEAEMTLHDAAMSQFSQWWKRAQRAGYAYFLGASIHGRSAEKYRVRECLRIFFWGGLPFATFFVSAIFSVFGLPPIPLIALLIYPMQWFRLWKKSDLPPTLARSWAYYNLLGKLPELTGAFRFVWNTLTSKRAEIIEYK